MPGIAHRSPKARNTASRCFYPYQNELHVTRKNGKLELDGDFGEKPDDSDLLWPPFRSFGNDYYSYQLLLDLKVGSEWAVRTEPHPRFYTDPTDTVPIAVPALLRTEWWPMISFIVFKTPAEGRTHIFRPNEPMLQILILPVTADFTLTEMNEEEAAEREMRGRRIHDSRPTLAADSTWTSKTNTVFDGTYRHLLRAAKAQSARMKSEAGRRAGRPACCTTSVVMVVMMVVMVVSGAVAGHRGAPRRRGDDGGGDDGDDRAAHLHRNLGKLGLGRLDRASRRRPLAPTARSEPDREDRDNLRPGPFRFFGPALQPARLSLS